MMINAPIIAATIPAIRRTPSFSPRNIAAPSVISMGLVDIKAAASDSGIRLRPVKKQAVALISKSDRKNCMPGYFVCTTVLSRGRTSTNTKSICPAYRAQSAGRTPTFGASALTVASMIEKQKIAAIMRRMARFCSVMLRFNWNRCEACHTAPVRIWVCHSD